MAKRSSTRQSKQNKREPQPQSWLLSTWKPYTMLFVLAFIVYSRTLSYGFIGFDDQVFVGNPAFSRVQDLWGQFTTSSSSEAYRPILFASIVVNSLVFGQQSAFGFHFMNVLFHALACSLVFAILVRLGYDRLLSFVLSAIFAAHPLLTQATAWVSGRNDPMVAIPLFASFVALTVYARNNSILALVVHLFTFTIANFTKESSVVMPGVCGLYMLLIVRERLFSQRMMLLTVAWLVIDIGYLVARSLVPHALISKSYTFRYLYGLDAFVAGWRAIPEFIGKMIVPMNQSGYTIFTTFSTVVGCIVTVLFVVGIVLALRSARQQSNQSQSNQSRASETTRWQYVVLGSAWMMLFLLLPMMRYQLHTAAFEQNYLEHRAYVPMVGLLIILAECIRAFVQAGSRYRMPIIAGLCAIALVFAARTAVYAEQYKDGLTFWRAIVAYNPQSALAWNSVGYFMMQANMPMTEVEPYMRKSVELAPTDTRYINGLAVVQLRLNNTPLAMQTLRRGLELDSTFSDAAYNLGYLIQQTQGMAGNAEAKRLFEQALRHTSGHFNSYLRLIATLIQENNLPAARALYQKSRNEGIDIITAAPQLAQYLK